MINSKDTNSSESFFRSLNDCLNPSATLEQLAQSIFETGAVENIINSESGTRLGRIGPNTCGGILIACFPSHHQTMAPEPLPSSHVLPPIFGSPDGGRRVSIAALLDSLNHIESYRLRYPLWIATGPANADAIKNHLDHISTQHVRPRLIINIDETQLKPVNQHLGSTELITRFYGKPHLTSQPWRGVNPLEYASLFSSKLLQFRSKLLLRQRNGLKPTLCITQIKQSMSSPPNQPPDIAEVHWSLHTTNDTETALVMDEALRYAIEELEPQMQAISSDAAITQEPVNWLPPLRPYNQDLIDPLDGLLKTPPIAAAIDSSSGLWQRIGVPTINYGPSTNFGTGGVSLRQAFAFRRFLDRVEAKLSQPRPD